MGHKLIKREVDASVFLINLTSALIKLVMTAELVPVSHQTLNPGKDEKKARAGQLMRGTAHFNKSHSGQPITST